MVATAGLALPGGGCAALTALDSAALLPRVVGKGEVGCVAH